MANLSFQVSCLLLCLLLLSSLATSSPAIAQIAQVKTSANQLDGTYDYIIVGGGTSGLTVADRLTEDGTKTVLVIEYGPLESNPDILLPSTGLTNFTADMYNYTSIPQPGLNNQTAVLRGGALVGGGSAVNSMWFDRGSAEDYDSWEKLGNPGWGWKGILPYFQKSVTFTPPSSELQTVWNFTYNMDAYGQNGPVHSSYPPYQWPLVHMQWNGWKNFGIPVQQEGADGSAYGLFWVPSSLDPKLQTRSYSRSAYYEPYVNRTNYHLLTGYHANTIIFSSDLNAEGIQIQPRFFNTSSPEITTVLAKKEVILATGAIGTPLILQRSGVGPKKFLQEAGIDVKVDLPGVGQNLQDHALIALLGYNFTLQPLPTQDMLASNATFWAESLAEYHENKTGPITGADGCAGVFLPLSTITDQFQTLISEARSQRSSQYLPSAYDPSVILGFEAQKSILLQSYASNTTSVIELPFTGKSGSGNLFLKPLSRASININKTDPSRPVIDFGVLTNPVDLKIGVAAFKLSRVVYESPYMAALGPVETNPGLSVTTDEDIISWIHNTALPSAAHPCGTAAMMPREIGGVVGSDLLVYGVKRLSVVDASIMPLIPGTHLSATVYAVAEKAADIIKARSEADCS